MSVKPMRILHCLRAPVGGLFRHVRDLAREQSARGHAVGVLCDANANDPLTEARLAELAGSLSLGLHKVGMSREIGIADISATRATRRLASELEVDVIHGHGAKGGAYARLATQALKRTGLPAQCFYTPHGGSLHYDPASIKGRAFMAAERHLMAMTDGLIFESRFAADTFAAKVAAPSCAVRVIHNGVLPEELRSVEHIANPADILFIGELRHLKGVDVLLDAIAVLVKKRSVSAVIVGAGPDAHIFQQQASTLGLDASVKFAGAMPAPRAFPLARLLVMPSRAESLPYVALEAAGAGIPLIATRVGGVPEIIEGTQTRLVEPGDVMGLAAAIERTLDDPVETARLASQLQQSISQRFSVAAMTASVLCFYAGAQAHQDARLRAAG